MSTARVVDHAQPARSRVDDAEVVTAVLTYRFLTIVPTLVLGLVAGATWKRHHPRAELDSGL
jgi:hypothetical protein